MLLTVKMRQELKVVCIKITKARCEDSPQVIDLPPEQIFNPQDRTLPARIDNAELKFVGKEQGWYPCWYLDRMAQHRRQQNRPLNLED
jgi:hypothetical protein